MSKSAIRYAFYKASAKGIMNAKDLVREGVDRKLAFLVNYKSVMMGYIYALLELGVIDHSTHQEFTKEINTLYKMYTR